VFRICLLYSLHPEAAIYLEMRSARLDAPDYRSQNAPKAGGYGIVDIKGGGDDERYKANDDNTTQDDAVVHDRPAQNDAASQFKP
jgi:hypothetical protein